MKLSRQVGRGGWRAVPAAVQPAQLENACTQGSLYTVAPASPSSSSSLLKLTLHGRRTLHPPAAPRSQPGRRAGPDAAPSAMDVPMLVGKPGIGRAGGRDARDGAA